MGITWHWPDNTLRPIGSVLKARKEKIDRKTVSFADLQPITIHFDGSIDPREVDEGREYTMKMFGAHPGDIIVAKIDLKNGAVGIVPADFRNVAVTGHFAVYSPDSEQLIPEYLQRVIQSAFFKAYLWRNKTGAEGRKEVKLDFFESAKIPLPPKNVQSAIVAYWHAADTAIEDAMEALNLVSEELDSWLRERTNNILLTRSWLALNWQDLKRWDAKTARAAAFRLAHPEFVPFGTYAEEATKMVKPFLCPKHEWPVYGVNNKEGVFFSHKQPGAEFNAPYKRIQKDWFFHNPTRSSVGSLGHVPEVPKDAITSPEYQVWKLRDLGKDSLAPGFVHVLIRTKWFVRVIQFHRVGAVKQRLYVENLLEMPVPKFPLDLQERIAVARAAALTKLEAARKRAEVVKQEVEEMILGVRPVPTTTKAKS